LENVRVYVVGENESPNDEKASRVRSSRVLRCGG
jgi:hypothetical protein